MRSQWKSQLSIKPWLALTLLLATYVAAQGNLPALPNSSQAAAAAATTSKGAATSSQAAAAATTSKGAATPSQAAAKTATKASGTTSGSALPGISSTTSSDALGVSGLPKLAGDNYPPPTVPPTANAPFMQKSNLPEGTVFICVGAALGFFGCLVLAWRGLVAWSLHRSVRRAAIAQSSKYSHGGRDPKGKHGNLKSPMFSPGPGSTLNLDQLAASGKAVGSKQHSGHNSLFFSPTAGTAMHTASNRGSGYLPAGYYAAGNAAPGGGSGMTHIGGGSRPLSHLGNQSRRYSRARSTGPSPPDSPSLPPSRGGDAPFGKRLSTQGLMSTSSLNLSAPQQGRAPSAYLEDLFENHQPGEMPQEDFEGRVRH